MYLTRTLHNALQSDPDRELTVDGTRVRTVAESVDRIARLARGLHALGVAPGDRVAMLGVNSDRYFEYLFAVPWAGAVLTPINSRWSPAEVAFALAESEARVLLIDNVFRDHLPSIRELYNGLDHVVYCGDDNCPETTLAYESLVADNDVAEDARRGGQDLLGLFYTGGTTGAPKGVMLSHNSVLTNALGCFATGEWLTQRGRMLHVAPMFHLADLFLLISGALAEHTHVLLPGFSPEGVLDAFERYRITDVLLVPTMLQQIADHPDAKAFDLSTVRRVLYGTSPVSESLLERVGALLPAAGLAQAYGMTELAPVATILRPSDHEDPALRRSAGRPAPHTEVRIVDNDDNEVPRGVVGEIVARGDHVMLGYWRRPDDTAAALRGGWMHTGDAGYMDERGYVFVVDRIKDMIVTGGENVYSAEVENVLSHHDAVAACAVIGVPDELWGERVHAVVMLRPDRTATAEQLRDFCRSRIAAYKAPRSVDFVEALPVSGAGKVLKRELRKAFWPSGGRQVG
ncbi:long-chain fatty acid--CoA ligase [Nocardia puris]|uniref:Acyl-CoA synthetase (AMP-forming)/AMP-acid ligase II n=1 Tax=Nocardia puris TaxID=208602 RepID=A0A366E3W4_9NOCA|nr:long-chain fatty acid--CoA ligase [Nocardia puris]MBF6216096.1 long-chain fatty acid--CoA ligase [Nocardia puris]MBF6368899.1 long-chain fatty acid--CoA ligase [Nocardia puris]MBF6462480.1 long-chain fatty acid--CoA ligase [Nocardia puris]RBO97061.1 acyl-CoA synthetase (AMP-forming)/AMP-acid ligase II [Nocardia puris]